MTDIQAIHDRIGDLREEADRDVRESLESIERALSGMQSDEEPPAPDHDRLKEVRAKLDRLADDTEGETAAELDRLREQVREFERDEA